MLQTHRRQRAVLGFRVKSGSRYVCPPHRLDDGLDDASRLGLNRDEYIPRGDDYGPDYTNGFDAEQALTHDQITHPAM